MTGFRNLFPLGLLGVSVLPGCRGSSDERPTKGGEPVAPAVVTEGSRSPVAPSAPPWAPEPLPPAAPEGMVWIPPGALVAGTPEGLLPRVPDQEPPGEQMVLSGFFMSIYPYPNEEAAIPLSNVTHTEARALCEERGQRLCTELEWERACKGPENRVYEYGDRYRPEVCGTGSEPRMLPSGLRVACRSDFGARDLHGSLWEWTASPWGRGTKEGRVAIRGGNGAAGEVIGRCANAAPRAPGVRSKAVGFRCCAGPANKAEVVLHVERHAPLELRNPDADPSLLDDPSRLLTDEARALLKHPDTFRVSRVWAWHPVGNEELLVLGGCTPELPHQACGVVVVRRGQAGRESLSWASSARYLPTLRVDRDPKQLWVYGGDDRSHFRRLVEYDHGRVVLGTTQRNMKTTGRQKGPTRPPP